MHYVLGEKGMRILLVHNFYKIPGGEDIVFQNEERLLREHGHEVLLYTRSNCELDEFSVFRKLLLPFTAIFSLRTFREIRKRILAQKIDLVHVHNTLTLVSPSVFYAALSCGVPVVQTLHNFRMECPNALFYRNGTICEECMEKGLFSAVRHACYRNSRMQSFVSMCILRLHRMTGIYRKVHYICLSEFNKEKLLQLNQGKREVVAPEKVFLKPNFVERKGPYGKPIPLSERKAQYLYVGRLEESKGILDVLQNYDKTSKDRLLICGSGPLEDKCRACVQERGLWQVEFLGQVPHERVLLLMRESKAVLFPSLLYEGQGLVVLESYLEGTPVLGNPVCAPVGNVKELLCPAVFTPEEGLKRTEFLPERNYELLMEIYQSVRGL